MGGRGVVQGCTQGSGTMVVPHRCSTPTRSLQAQYGQSRLSTASQSQCGQSESGQSDGH